MTTLGKRQPEPRSTVVAGSPGSFTAKRAGERGLSMSDLNSHPRPRSNQRTTSEIRMASPTPPMRSVSNPRSSFVPTRQPPPSPSIRMPSPNIRMPSPTAPMRTLSFVSRAPTGAISQRSSFASPSIRAPSPNIRMPSPTPPMRTLSFVPRASSVSIQRPQSASSMSIMRSSAAPSALSPRSRSSRASSPAPQSHRPSSALRVAQEDTLHWLLELGVNPVNRKAVATQTATATVSDVAQAFVDGLLLCRLVGILEGKEVSGLDQQPRSAAAQLVNINRALTVLRNRKRMNPRYLWAGDQILRGDPESVWGLLEDIRREYSKTSSQSQTRLSRGLKVRPTPHSSVSSMSMANTSVNVSLEAADLSPLKPAASMSAAIAVSAEQEEQVRGWLQSLHFDLPDPFQSGTAMSDPLRNGLLLCELVSVLENERVQGVHKRPRTLGAVRANTEAALTVLRQKRQIPTTYLFQTEELLKGNRNVLWGLLWHMMRAYPRIQADAQRHLAPTQSPYAPRDMQQLEDASVHWLHALGLTESGDVPATLDDIMPLIRNGTLLCQLAEIVTGNKILGIFERPRTAATRLANINKACTALRQRPGMSQRFVWQENAVANGDHAVILGLLEDMRRLYDHLPPRPTHAIDYERPYLGRTSAQAHASSVGSRQTLSQSSLSSAGTNAAAHRRSQSTMSMSHQRGRMVERPATPPTELRSSVPSPSRAVTPGRIPVAPERFTFSGDNDYDEDDLLPAPAPPSAPPDMVSVVSSVDSTAREPSEGYLLVQWMQSLGIKVSSQFVLDSPVASEFCDGLLLCQLIGKLEHRTLTGITLNPKTGASFLHNINKALEELRLRKNMNVQYLYSATEILHGNTYVIRGLLEHMRHAYGHHLNRSASMLSRPPSAIKSRLSTASFTRVSSSRIM